MYTHRVTIISDTFTNTHARLYIYTRLHAEHIRMHYTHALTKKYLRIRVRVRTRVYHTRMHLYIYYILYE